MTAQYNLNERSCRIWRAISNAGRGGLSKIALVDMFKGVFDSAPIKSSLQSMRSGGYIDHIGSSNFGQYIITADCKIPAGEDIPAWLTDPESDIGDLPLTGTTSQSTHQTPKGPASVFTFAAAMGDPAPQRLPKPKPAPAQPRTEPKIETDFVCSLSSRGELFIAANGASINLQADATRELLHYLDTLLCGQSAGNLMGALS